MSTPSLRHTPRRAALALLAAASLLLVVLAPAGAGAATLRHTTMEAGAAWLISKQTPSGSFGAGFGSTYAPGAVAATGRFSAGRHLADLRAGGGQTARQFVAQTYTGPSWVQPLSAVDGYTNPQGTGLGTVTWGILSLHAAGYDPQRIAADQNHLALLATAYRPSGAFGSGGSNFSAFALLSLTRLGAPGPIVAKTRDYLIGQQLTEGSWSIATITDANRGGKGGPEVTGAVLASLCEAGLTTSHPAVERGLTYLRAQLRTGGGISTDPLEPSNADTVAWVINGLNACGLDPTDPEWTAPDGSDLIDYLATQQVPTGQPEAGSFLNYVDEPSLYTTQNVVRALAEESYSADPPARLNPADPTTVTPTEPPAGTPTPHAVIVDFGGGLLRFCRAVTLTGGNASTLIASLPDSCRPHDGDGQWTLAIEREPAEPLASQPIGFGDTVTVTRVPGTGTRGPVGDDPVLPPAGPPADPLPPAVDPGPSPDPGPGTTPKPQPKPELGRVKVTCKLSKTRKQLTCSSKVKALRTKDAKRAKATLAKSGRTYAKGSLTKLKRTRKLTRGTYVLRIPSLGATARIKLK